MLFMKKKFSDYVLLADEGCVNGEEEDNRGSLCVLILYFIWNLQMQFDFIDIIFRSFRHFVFLKLVISYGSKKLILEL